MDLLKPDSIDLITVTCPETGKRIQVSILDNETKETKAVLAEHPEANYAITFDCLECGRIHAIGL